MEEQKIIELLCEDPEKGIHEAMNLYGGAVATICRNFLYDCDEMDIEEAIADSFLKLWKSRDKIVAYGKKTIKSYLFEIARNTARDKRRSLKNVSVFPLDEIQMQFVSPLNIEEEYARKINYAILHDCLDSLKEPDKSVFMLRYFYAEKTFEISRRLNISPKKVENILCRGKKILEKALNERGIFHG